MYAMFRVNFVDLIPLDKIILDPEPVRQELNAEHIQDLIDSLNILKMGPLEPLVVKPIEVGLYQVLSGNHRYMALKQGGWTEAPCHVIEPLNEAEEFLMKLHANTKRKNLSDLESCEAMVREKAIYEAFYPESRQGCSKLLENAHNAHFPQKAYYNIKAASLGVTRSTLHRDLQVGEIVLEIPALKGAKATKAQVLTIAQRKPEERQLLKAALEESHNKEKTLKRFLRQETPLPPAKQPDYACRIFKETLRLLQSGIPWHHPDLKTKALQLQKEEVLLKLANLAASEHAKISNVKASP